MNLDDRTIAVIGLGYVGLPLALAFGKTRKVIGFDINEGRIAALRRGEDATREATQEDFAGASHLSFSSDPEDLKECGIFIVTVPTPIDKANRPDLTPLLRASETVGQAISPGAVVIFESTVYPPAPRRSAARSSKRSRASPSCWSSTIAMQEKRLVISVNTSWNIFNFRAGLIRGLIAEGYEIIAVAPPDDYSSRLTELGCRFIPLPMDNKGVSPLQDLLLLWRYWMLLAKVRPDAFLGYTIKPNIYGTIAAHLLGIPTINNVAGMGAAFNRNNWLMRVAKDLYRLALRPSRLVFFQNAEDRALFIAEKLVRAENTAVLPGSGIDLDAFQPAFPRSADGEFRFLLLGRLLWDKGVGEYVEAARRIRTRCARVRFQLLGFLGAANPGAIDQQTMDGWVREGIVEYLGKTDDVRPFIAKADCIALPSYYREGTPRSLLEVAAMARPIVTTDWIGCRDVVDDGVNGLLCKPCDADDLEKQMLRMLGLSDEERSAMGARGREKVERQFDEKIVIHRYVDAISEVLSKRDM